MPLHRSLAVFVLWGLIIQLCCVLWAFTIHRKRSFAELARNALLLTNNNTGSIGWPLVSAMLGPGPASIALLLGILVYIQFTPFAMTFFEWQLSQYEVRRVFAVMISLSIETLINPMPQPVTEAVTQSCTSSCYSSRGNL